MNELSGILDPSAGPWLTALLRASLQGGVALAIVWLLCRGLPMLPPAWKCWLLRLAYVKLLVALCWQAIDLPLLRPDTSGETLGPVAKELPDHPPLLVATRADALVAWHTRLDHIFLAVWIAGSGIAIIVVAFRWRAAGWLRHQGSTPVDPSLLRGYEQSALALGVRRPPPLLTADLATGPLLVGLIRPAIVLPGRLVGSDAARLRLMLAHELAHYRRHDLPWGLLPMVARILFWFHPVVWAAEREWWLARESACDQFALAATGASAADYGRTLIDAATSAGDLACRFTAAGVIESRFTLERRLSAMRYFPLASRRRWTFIGSGLVLAWALALVPVRLTAQPATNPAADSSHSGAAAGGGRAPATEAAWQGALALPGTVEARTSEVRPAIDGVITVVRCDIGQAVKQGDLLFQLDDAAARAQLEAALAQYEGSRAKVEIYEKRASKGIVNSEDVREMTMNRDVAAADVAVKQAVLKQFRIVAPIGGVVSRRNANPGDVVNRGAPLATIVQLDPLSVLIDVGQSQYSLWQVGQDVRVRCNSVLGTQFVTGKVSFISPQIDPSTRTAVVKATVGNVDGKLKPGMYVDVEFLAPRAGPKSEK